MQGRIKFSIGIPAFKFQFLKECIISILSQSYTNFELIIINDHSPYDLDSIVQKFNDERIKYIVNKQNVGAENVVDNWNKCLNLAIGDFFILMGDDDVMCDNYLEEFTKLIAKYPNRDVYHCRSQIINEKSETIAFTPSTPEIESVYDNMWHRIKGFRVQYISDFVYRTSVLKQNKGFFKLPLAWASDDISSFIAANNYGIAHSSEPVFKYRSNTHSISSTGTIELKLKAITQEENWYNQFLETIPSNPVDKIIRDNILYILFPYFKKKRIITISQSNGIDFNRLIKLIIDRKRLKIDLSIIFAGIIRNYLKHS